MNKVENAKLDKKLIGDEVTVSKIKPRGPRGPRGPKQPTLRQLIINIDNRLTQITQANNLVDPTIKK